MAGTQSGPVRALYYSRVRATFVPRILGLAFIFFGATFVILAISQCRVDFLLVPLIIVPAGSFIAFMTVTVKVDEQNVVIVFCDIFKRTLPRAEIATVTTDKTAGLSGYGFRYMGPGMVGYLVGGPEINIETKARKTVIASTDNPRKLISVLTDPSQKRGQLSERAWPFTGATDFLRRDLYASRGVSPIRRRPESQHPVMDRLPAGACRGSGSEAYQI